MYDNIKKTVVITGGNKGIGLAITEKFLKENKSILILVPEINLIPQLLKRFKNRFKGEIVHVVKVHMNVREVTMLKKLDPFF